MARHAPVPTYQKEHALRATRKPGERPIVRRAVGPGERWNTREVLKRTGLRVRDEAPSRDDLSGITDGLAKLGAGDFTGSAGAVLVTVLGGIFGLLLLNLFLSDRGSKITAAGSGLVTGFLSRLTNPNDPIVATSSAALAATSTGSSSSSAGQGHRSSGSSGSSAAAPRSGVPKPSGRFVPIPGGNGHALDAAYVPLVEYIMRAFHVAVTSGYRSPAQNRAAGGASNSDHLYGRAVDFAGTPAAMETLYRWAVAAHFPYVESPAQAQAAGEGAHVHISFFRP